MPKDLGRKIKFADLADNEGTLKVAKMFQEACDAVPTTSAGPSASLVNTSDIHEKFEFRLAPLVPRFCFRQAVKKKNYLRTFVEGTRTFVLNYILPSYLRTFVPSYLRSLLTTVVPSTFVPS